MVTNAVQVAILAPIVVSIIGSLMLYEGISSMIPVKSKSDDEYE